MITIIHDTPSIAGNYLAELRDVTVQQNKVLFRRNIQRLGVFMAHELSKHLSFEIKKIQTPLGIADCTMVNTPIVLGTILRAGLPLHQGILNYFDQADNAFISAYRKHTSLEEFDIHVEYLASPKLDNRIVILSDPMLATGSSLVTVYKALLKQGKPSKIIIVAAIATPDALEYIQRHLPENTDYWVGAIDKELTAQSYIVPGLGDAGDLAFGEKY